MKVGDFVKIKGRGDIGVVHKMKDGKPFEVAFKTPHGVEIINTISLIVQAVRLIDVALQVIVPIVKKWWRKFRK